MKTGKKRSLARKRKEEVIKKLIGKKTLEADGNDHTNS